MIVYFKQKTKIQRVLMIALILIFGSFFISGCQSDTAEKTKVIQPKKGPPPFSLKGNLDDLTPLDQIVAIGGLNLIGETVEVIKTELTSFLATPMDLRSMWLDNYVQTEMLFDPKFVHPKRPLRFLQVLDKGEVHTVRIVGILSLEDLKQSLGTYLEVREVQGVKVYVQNRYKEDKSPLHFVSLGDDLIASTYNIDLLSAPFIKYYQAAGKRKVDGVFSALFFPKRVSDRLKSLEKSEQVLDQLELKGSARSVERQRGFLKNIIESAKSLASDSERITLTLKLDQPNITFDVDWSITPGSSSDQWISVTKGGEHQLIKHAGTAALLLSLNLPSKILNTIIQTWNQLALSSLSPSQTVKKSKTDQTKSHKKKPKSLPPVLSNIEHINDDYIRLVKESAEHLGGSVLLAAIPYKREVNSTKKQDAKLDPNIFLSPQSANALRWLGLFNHNDQAKVSEGIQQILSIYKDPEVSKNIRRRGLKINVKDQNVKIGEQEYLTTHIKTRMPRTPRMLRVLRPQLRELYNAHLWITDRFGGVGFADSWQSTLATLNQSLKVDDPQDSSFVTAAFQAGVAQPALFLYFDPLTTISSLKRGKAGSMLLPLQMMFSAVKATEGLSLSIGTSDHSVKARLCIPHRLMEAIKSGMSGITQDVQTPSLASPQEVR
jgi:hypothetical protein